MKKRKPQRFRFTVDKLDGKFTTHSLMVTSESRRESSEDEEIIVRPDHTFVDEVVIGGVIHLEAMSDKEYWINVAGVTLWVTLRKDGSVKQVHVYEPGEYDEPREGVEYGFKVTPPKSIAKTEDKKARKLMRKREKGTGKFMV